MQKIQKIRNDLSQVPEYIPSDDHVPELSDFRPMDYCEVKRIIKSMSTKSCEIDAIPAWLLKENLDGFLEIVTSLINLSLSNDTFVKQWKTAIVQPLLKKSNLELLPSNYRPVSNLPFLSKVLEKCAVYQFNEHCDTHCYLIISLHTDLSIPVKLH